MKSRCVALLLIGWLVAAEARGDGGTLRLSQKRDGFIISVFTSPTPLRAGSVDISVLIQDETTRKVRLDVPVTIHVASAEMPARKLTRSATTDEATNKLFRAAHFELPSPGSWAIEVVVNGSAKVELAVEIGEKSPAWLELTWWIIWPTAAVGLFAAHQWLARKRLTTETQRR